MNHPDWQLLAEKAALYLYPRRCPFCGAVLGRDAVQGTVCPACFEAADKRLVHLPPRLPETEHAFYALNSAVAAYYYSGEVRHAILACKRGGELWRARELADRMAVLIWGAMPSHTPGRRPAALAPVGMPRYHYIVPVPPREPLPGTAGMPLLLARRLGILMQTPVLAPLYSTKPLQPQKELTRAERLANKKDAYACRPGTDLSGKRVLLVDGEPVKLTATELKIVDLLMRNLGRVFPAEEIYRRVWNEEAYATENTVMVHIRRIREKIELNPKEPEYLKVVWGIGYKIEKR